MTLLFQHQSVKRYYCLRGKRNAQIVTKLEQGYHQDAPRLRTVENWAARFRAGLETVEDDEKPGRDPQNNLGDTVLRFFEKQPHSSSRKINDALYSPRTTILRVLDELGSRFFAPKWMADRLFVKKSARKKGHVLHNKKRNPPQKALYYIDYIACSS
jgi:hypothetical protein